MPPPHDPPRSNKSDDSDTPCLTPDVLKEISSVTRRTANLKTYTWEETFGDGWWDRDSRFWDVHRPVAWSDTSDYSEADSYHSSENSDEDDNSHYYEPGI